MTTCQQRLRERGKRCNCLLDKPETHYRWLIPPFFLNILYFCILIFVDYDA